MKHVLIITEDIIKIQTLSGFLGGLFKSIYITWLKLRLKLTIILLRPFFKLTIVTSDTFKLNHHPIYYYGNKLARLDYAANRSRHLNIADRLLKDLGANLFKNRLAIYLTYDYFIYANLYQNLLKQLKPDLVITLSSSYHEQIACFLAKKYQVKTIKLHWLTFIWLNHWLKKFFLRRQYHKKINQFLTQSQVKPPSLKKLQSATFLSLDFYRHLKTLAPIYKTLNKHNHNPWLVVDIANPKPALKNLKLGSANHVFLASFLPADFKTHPTSLPKKLTSVTSLNDFLHNLSLKAATPMISYGQRLSQLYLAAAENLFKLSKPQAVVVVSDLRFCELALTSIAQATQTRSLLVSPNTLLALDQLNSYNTTDLIAVVGQFIKKQLINLGLNSSKIKIIGDPRTENYRQLVKPLDSQKIFHALGLKSNQSIVLLISFPPTSMIPKPEKKAFFKLASQAVAANPNTILVIKPHPSERRYRVLEDLEQWGITNAIVTDNNQLELMDLLNACSVVLQTWSMTIFEATVMNRPVISINPFKKDYGLFLPILKSAAIEVNTQVQLKRWLKILKDSHKPQTKKLLQRAKQACAKFIKPTTNNTSTFKALKLLFS